MNVFSLFAGLGGGSLGFQMAGWDLVGAIDANPDLAANYEYLTGGHCDVADVADLTPRALRRLASGPPDCVLITAPCQGFSKALPKHLRKERKYQELRYLGVDTVRLVVAAWDVPVILMENVPAVAGAAEQVITESLLRSAGYAVVSEVLDCGRLGGLGQTRLRHFTLGVEPGTRVPEPSLSALRSVGDVIGSLPRPRPGRGIHCLPRSIERSWLRWAAIPPGGDYRDLPPRFAIGRTKAPAGTLGVLAWDRPAYTICGATSSTNRYGLVADPREPTHGPVSDIDGTWHRPLTTLELAALQGLPVEVRGERLRLAGKSQARWRQAIGNALPPPAAKTLAHLIAELTPHGDFQLDAAPLFGG